MLTIITPEVSHRNIIVMINNINKKLKKPSPITPLHCLRPIEQATECSMGPSSKPCAAAYDMGSHLHDGAWPVARARRYARVYTIYVEAARPDRNVPLARQNQQGRSRGGTCV